MCTGCVAARGTHKKACGGGKTYTAVQMGQGTILPKQIRIGFLGLKSLSGEPEPTAASRTGMERRQWNRSRLPPVADARRRRFWLLAGDWQAKGRRQSRQNQREMKRHGGSGLSVATAEPYRRWQSPENQRRMQGGGGSGFWQATGKPKGADRAAKTRGR